MAWTVTLAASIAQSSESAFLQLAIGEVMRLALVAEVLHLATSRRSTGELGTSNVANSARKSAPLCTKSRNEWVSSAGLAYCL